MAFGVVPTGFNRKRLDDIKASIEDALRTEFGDVDVSAQSVFGQFNGVIAEPISDLWEEAENVFNALNPNAAEDVAHDNIAQVTGITRLTAINSVVYGSVTGSDGTIISAGSSVTKGGNVFTSQVAYNISETENLSKITVEILSAIEGDDYSVTVGDVTYTHTATAGNTESNISTAIAALVNAATTTDGFVGVATNEFLTINRETYSIPFNISVDGSHIDTVNTETYPKYNYAQFIAADSGPIIAPLGSFTINTPISGWESCVSFVDALVGRNEETDSELRIRRRQSLSNIGAASVDAIRARIVDDVDGVSVCKVFENATNTTVSGRPPHSIEVLVVGGDDQDIADKLFDVKSAGIETVSTGTEVSKTVLDDSGISHTIKFSRPTEIPIYMAIEYEVYSEEEFPVDGEAQIKSAALSYGNAIGIGTDVLIQRFSAYIFQTVPGIKRLAVTVNLTGDPVTETDDIEIFDSEVAFFEEANIEVTEAP